jgi:hypothetical protein
VGSRGSHIFWTIGSQMAVRLSALRTDCPLLPARFLVLVSVRGCVDTRAIVRLERLGQLKNPVTSSTIYIYLLSVLLVLGSLFLYIMVYLPLSGFLTADTCHRK